jgi:predicted metal-dependent hydrolase
MKGSASAATLRSPPSLKRAPPSPWGSCGKGGRLYFHWRSILLPPRIADYVVVHELVHLREPHHSPGFWRAVERVLPDFAHRKQWLAEHGAEVGAI